MYHDGVSLNSSTNLCLICFPIREEGSFIYFSHSLDQILLSIKFPSSSTMSSSRLCLRLVVNTIGTVWQKTFFRILTCFFNRVIFLYLFFAVVICSQSFSSSVLLFWHSLPAYVFLSLFSSELFFILTLLMYLSPLFNG